MKERRPLPLARHEFEERADYLPRLALLVLAGAVFLLGIMPGTLVAQILASLN